MQAKSKAIIEYILRIGLFLILNRQFAFELPLMILMTLSECFQKYYTSSEDWLTIVIIGLIIYMYLVAKLCGIFKKLDNLYFIKAFLIICLINLILNFTYMFTIQFVPFKISFHKIDDFWYFYPLLFVCYRILNWLGKKFPNTLGKIGYYCSIEFYKGLFKKILSEIKKKG